MIDCISICMILALMIALFNIFPAKAQVRRRGLNPVITRSVYRKLGSSGVVDKYDVHLSRSDRWTVATLAEG